MLENFRVMPVVRLSLRPDRSYGEVWQVNCEVRQVKCTYDRFAGIF